MTLKTLSLTLICILLHSGAFSVGNPKKEAQEMLNIAVQGTEPNLLWLHPKAEGCAGYAGFEIWLVTFGCITEKHPECEPVTVERLAALGLAGTGRHEIVAAYRRGQVICTVMAVREDILNFQFNKYVLTKNPWGGANLFDVFDASGKRIMGSMQS